MTKALIFDFDGTLADTCEGIVRTMFHTLREMGLPPTTRERVVSAIGLPLRETFALNSDIPADRIEEAVLIYRAQCDDIIMRTAKTFDGVPETLSEIGRRGLPMAIASSRGTKSLDNLTHILGIDSFISDIFGEEYATHPKPAPDLALHILKAKGWKAEEVLVVGDTTFDIGMGQGAGCQTCGVTFGNQSREQLAAQGADYIIDRFEQLLDLL